MAEKHIDLIRIDSSNIYAIGYDAAERILEIQFRSGGVYRYYDVPQAVHREFMSSISKGRYFYNAIKGAFRYRKVAERPAAATPKR